MNGKVGVDFGRFSTVHHHCNATWQVRVRGLHLMEGHVLVDGLPVSAPLL